MSAGERSAEGLRVRREVMGAAWVDPLMKAAEGDPFAQASQDLAIEAWGTVWTRPGLPRKTRSMLNLAILTALGKMIEFKGHIRGAIANGCTPDEIMEVLLHATVYCGVPAGVEAFRNAKEALDALDR
jgi:4-carboxymuconolactone decarboxylase